MRKKRRGCIGEVLCFASVHPRVARPRSSLRFVAAPHRSLRSDRGLTVDRCRFCVLHVLQNRTFAENANPNIAFEDVNPNRETGVGLSPILSEAPKWGTADERERGPLGAERMRGWTIAKHTPPPTQPLRAERMRGWTLAKHTHSLLQPLRARVVNQGRNPHREAQTAFYATTTSERGATRA